MENLPNTLNISVEEINFDDLSKDLKSISNEDIEKLFNQVNDLREHTKKTEEELSSVLQASIPDYLYEYENTMKLAQEINDCDEMFAKFEELLTNSQQNLSSINNEIKTIQDLSLSNNLKLNNRKTITHELKNFINNIELPAELQRAITKNDVDKFYIEYLIVLNKKIAFLSTVDNDYLVKRDIKETINDLRKVAVLKVSDFLFKQINMIKDINSLRACHTTLTNYSFLYMFLFKNSPEMAKNVEEQYIENTSKFYTSYLKAYLYQIIKLSSHVAKKTDLLGVDDHGGKLQNIIPLSKTKKKLKNTVNIFGLGNRLKILNDLETPPYDVSLGSPEGHLFPFEFIFRSSLYILMCMITPEAMFVQDFFLSQGNITPFVFQKIFAIYSEAFDTHFANCFDSLGIAMMMCIIERYYEVMSFRRLDLMNNFFEATIKKLNHRFNYIFHLNLESIKQANSKNLKSTSTFPHFVTRRCAEYISALFTLSGLGQTADKSVKGTWLVGEGLDEKGLSENRGNFTFRVIIVAVDKLCSEMEHLFGRLASIHVDSNNHSLFFLNNYDMILQVMFERIIKAEYVEYFQKKLQEEIKRYSQLQLSSYPYFHNLQTFVDEFKSLLISSRDMEKKGTVHISQDAEHIAKSSPRFCQEIVESILKEFSIHWKTGAEAIKQTIITNFFNLNNGISVYQTLLETIFEMYNDFTILIMNYFRPLTHTKHYIAVTEVSYEMKKLCSFFDK